MATKIGRNEPCPCGSGKKFKQCHGAQAAAGAPVPVAQNASQLVMGALQLQQAGDLDAAESLYQKALALEPRNPDALHLLGLLKHQTGKPREAVALIESAIAAKSGIAEFHSNCGEAYRAMGWYSEAITQYNRALDLSPQFAEALINRGVVQKALGEFAAAEQSYRDALEIRPNWPQAHANLANLLRTQARHVEAEAEYKLALSGRPGDAQLYNDLGVVLVECRDGVQAVKYLERARDLDPGNPDVLSNLGIAHELLRDTPLAIHLYEQALALSPSAAVIRRNLGLALYNVREIQRSVEAYESSLKLAPEDADTHVNLAFSLFSLGDLPRGWEQYEWRSKQQAEPSRAQLFRAKEWKGEDILGASILVWGEQGVGDQLWFAGMYQDLAGRVGDGGRLIIECAPKLTALLQRSFRAATVVPQENPPHPATGLAKYQVSAGRIGRHLRCRFEDFNEQPRYLLAEAGRIEHWRSKFEALGHHPKIGICWRSNNAAGRRADAVTALTEWGSVLRVPGVEFINLQYDECRAELELAQSSFDVAIRHFEEVDMFDDLDETAALISALDLVISAPTSVSVLAPALGVPTWQLNYIEDWRAFGQQKNHWHPTLTTWNRAYSEDWETVLERVAAELRESVGRLTGGADDRAQKALER